MGLFFLAAIAAVELFLRRVFVHGAVAVDALEVGQEPLVGSEPPDRLDVDVPGPLGKAGKPHVVDHTLTQRGHGRSPFGFKRQDLCPGTDQIPQPAALNDCASYGEAVQSNRGRMTHPPVVFNS